MSRGNLAWVVALLLVGTGCSTVTLRDQGTGILLAGPTFQSSEPFFFWGLKGTAHVDVTRVCGGREARQLQAQTTFVDGLVSVLTLGIYAPRSVKIWCEAG